MGGVSLVRVDSSVRSERSSVGLGSLLNDNVLDDQVLNSDVLGLGVGLGVLEQSEDESDRLLGPSS